MFYTHHPGSAWAPASAGHLHRRACVTLLGSLGRGWPKNATRSYLKQIQREYFTRTLHGIHKIDEGLCIKFDTIVMQCVYYGVSRIWATIIMSNNVQLLVNKAYLQLPRFGKMVIDMETFIYPKTLWIPSANEERLDWTTRTMVPCMQGFRHPARNECMGWFAQLMKNQPFIIRRKITKQRNSLFQNRVYEKIT